MEMIAFTSFKKHKLLPLLLLAVTASIVLAGIPPIQAAPTPRLVVGNTVFVPAGSLTTTKISVQSMVPFDAFDVAIFADSGAIDPQSISIGSLLSSPLILTNCVDGAGIGSRSVASSSPKPVSRLLESALRTTFTLALEAFLPLPSPTSASQPHRLSQSPLAPLRVSW